MSMPILYHIFVSTSSQSVGASAFTENKHNKFNISFWMDVKILEYPLDFKPSLRMTEVQFPQSGHMFIYISFLFW